MFKTNTVHSTKIKKIVCIELRIIQEMIKVNLVQNIIEKC